MHKKVIRLTEQRLENLKKNVSGLSSELGELKTLANLEGNAVMKALDKVKTDLDNANEIGEMESLRLQMAIDQISKMTSTLSNLLKKISDISSEIKRNLK